MIEIIIKDIAINRKARFDYHILEAYETGIALKGTEVKSAREGQVTLKDSFGKVDNGEVFLYNMHISPYSHGSFANVDPTRKRKLLLHKNEIERLTGKLSVGGLVLVPLKIYLKGNLVKVEIALAKSKKNFDKRDAIKKREVERDIKRTLAQ
ncbi:MAG: SsrA-binding protein [Candidatus Firestonebacteria bacterium RIFOXYA2_FULL_40_8]|nr:MAG: SsrA-binding protein [Candidatus Firestonebacteria bacterium RIFOXYA2_FULL_40_8]